MKYIIKIETRDSIVYPDWSEGELHLLLFADEVRSLWDSYEDAERIAKELEEEHNSYWVGFCNQPKKRIKTTVVEI